MTLDETLYAIQLRRGLARPSPRSSPPACATTRRSRRRRSSTTSTSARCTRTSSSPTGCSRPAIVTEQMCAACVHNRPSRLQAAARVDVARRGLPRVAGRVGRHARSSSTSPCPTQGPVRPARLLPRARAAGAEPKFRARLKEYCQKVYKKTHVTKMEEKVATTCQRENPFYIDTVRAFRDRRYEYKKLNKTWGKKKRRPRPRATTSALLEAKDDVRAVRLAPARAQVHPQLVLRLRDAQGRALVLDGDGGRRDVHRRGHHQGGAHARRADRQDARARHRRHLVRLPVDLPAGLHLQDRTTKRRRWASRTRA